MKTIADSILLADAERVTIWIAGSEAPTDFWSLREAVSWAAAKGGQTLYRPQMDKTPAAWVFPEQVARLEDALISDQPAPSRKRAFAGEADVS